MIDPFTPEALMTLLRPIVEDDDPEAYDDLVRVYDRFLERYLQSGIYDDTADASSKDKWKEALIQAAYIYRRLMMGPKLLRHLADIKMAGSDYGDYMIDPAVELGDYRVVTLYGDSKDDNYYVALMAALQKGAPEMVTYVLDRTDTAHIQRAIKFSSYIHRRDPDDFPLLGPNLDLARDYLQQRLIDDAAAAAAEAASTRR